MLFWEDMIALISMLELLLFLCQYELLYWIFRIWIHITIKKIYTEIMPKYHSASKILFYHLPTRGRAGIKLGDSLIRLQRIYNFWLLHAILSTVWAILGFIIHFYIIFGTNLLTGGPAQICCFMPISVFRGKGISDGVKTERNQLEKLILEGNQPDGLGVHARGAPGCPRGWGARSLASWAPRRSTDVPLAPIYTYVP